ncbi:MAG TPA: ATP-binding protein [Candidatus Binatus sp.]|nr:ATP-binding protein [Candidatus Binatus sp.]
MERKSQRNNVGIANQRVFGGGKNGVVIAPVPISMARARRRILKRLENAAQESEGLTLSGRMAAVFAHEVANPLSGIFIALEFVNKALESPELDIRSLTATVQGAMREIERLRSMLKEFRGIAQPQSIEFEKIDLEQTTREVLSCQRAAYTTLGVTVEVEFQNPLPAVMAQPDKIKQVVLNLCKNAVEAMSDGGCLTVKGYRFEQTVVLEISDTGVGIPADLDVFELFRTTKRDGGGLGLALVRQIVLAHNGTINCTSEQGPGHRTTFRVSLPTAD